MSAVEGLHAERARVTVVIPVYEKAHVVSRAVESVMAQHDDRWRLVIVDDGSSDDPRSRLKPLLRDPRVTLVEQPNRGPGAARNRGARAATTPYLAFLDADDAWSPRFLSEVVGALEAHPTAAVAASGWHRHAHPDVVAVPTPSGRSGQWTWDAEQDPAQFKRVVDALHNSAAVVRREVFDRSGGYFEEGCTYGEDSWMWAPLALHEQIVFVDEVLVDFHTDASSLSTGRQTAYPPPPLVSRPEHLYGAAAGARRIFAEHYAAWYFGFVLRRSLAQGEMWQAAGLVLDAAPRSREHRAESRRALWDFARDRVRDRTGLPPLGLSRLTRRIDAGRSVRTGPRLRRVAVKYYARNNLGDDLFVYLLARRYLDSFRVVVDEPNATFDSLANIQVSTPPPASPRHRWASAVAHGRGHADPALVWRGADLLVHVGGSVFIEHPGSMPRWRREAQQFARLRTPYLVLGANFGPWTSPDYPRVVGSILAGARDVCFREQASARLFAHLDRVRCAPDLAFSLPTHDLTSLSDGSTLISVMDFTTAKGPEVAARFEAWVARAARTIVADGGSVVLSSFCRFQGDEDAAGRILDLLPPDWESEGLVRVHRYRGDVVEALRLLAACERVIGTRFHATILGLHLGKPVLPVVYSAKTTHALADAGYAGPTLALDDLDPADTSALESFGTLDTEPLAAAAQGQFEVLDTMLTRRLPG